MSMMNAIVQVLVMSMLMFISMLHVHAVCPRCKNQHEHEQKIRLQTWENKHGLIHELGLGMDMDGHEHGQGHGCQAWKWT
jgi:hypothetical protein